MQYFRYWGHSKTEMQKFNIGYSIVNDKGQPTPTYSIVQAVNQQIQRLAWVFSGAQSDAVYHMGKYIPQRTQKLSSIPEQFKVFSTNAKNALISFMSNNGKKFVIVQNKSLNEEMVLNYRLKESIKKIDNTSGKLIGLNSSIQYKDIILPGDILIFACYN